MVGRDLLKRLEKKRTCPGRPVLEIQDLSVLNDKKLVALKRLDLVVRQNEILGMAGITGNGQKNSQRRSLACATLQAGQSESMACPSSSEALHRH